MRIGFESSILNRAMTGVANYTFNVIRCAMELDPNLDFRGFGHFNWKKFDRDDALRVSRYHQKQDETENTKAASGNGLRNGIVDSAVRLRGARTAAAMYRGLRQRRFSSSVRKQSLDLFHAFNFRPLNDPGIPTLPVIYDLSTFRHPEFHPPDRVNWLEPLRLFLEQAPLVQTISDFSKREIVEVFKYPSERIFVAPPAASDLFVPHGIEKTQRGLGAMDLTYGKFFLIVGTHEPRKNIRSALFAYERLAAGIRAQYPLVLAGGKGWGDLDLPAKTESLIREGTVRLVRGVADPQLRNLYEGTRLLIAPSLYEGFGMPVVEAMACGTPVAHSADTSMDEISGSESRRVSALDVEGWTSALKDSLESDDYADPARRASRMACARKFTWQHSASLVIDAYRQIGGVT